MGNSFTSRNWISREEGQHTYHYVANLAGRIDGTWPGTFTRLITFPLRTGAIPLERIAMVSIVLFVATISCHIYSTFEKAALSENIPHRCRFFFKQSIFQVFSDSLLFSNVLYSIQLLMSCDIVSKKVRFEFFENKEK